jgi:hypothetical protein
MMRKEIKIEPPAHELTEREGRTGAGKSGMLMKIRRFFKKLLRPALPPLSFNLARERVSVGLAVLKRGE